MPSINPEIGLKISNLLKTSGKLSEASFNEAKKRFESNGKAPLGILEYLIKDMFQAALPDCDSHSRASLKQHDDYHHHQEVDYMNQFYE